jgi:tetratricopeptide (TPR) repeat protein
MWVVRNNYDEAERLYRRALELDLNNATNTGQLANFVCYVRKNYDEAERQYRHALELDPKDSTNLGNFAQFLALRGRSEEARKCLKRTLLEPDQDQAGAAFILWLLDRTSSQTGAKALGRLRAVVDAGFLRSPWYFDELLATMLPRLPDSERSLARKIAAAILDETEVAALDDEPLWKAVSPIPLSVPWSEVVND